MDTSTWHAAADAGDAHRDIAQSLLAERTSWALMERLAITQALAFDAGFRIHRYGPHKSQASTAHP